MSAVDDTSDAYIRSDLKGGWPTQRPVEKRQGVHANKIWILMLGLILANRPITYTIEENSNNIYQLWKEEPSLQNGYAPGGQILSPRYCVSRLQFRISEI